MQCNINLNEFLQGSYLSTAYDWIAKVRKDYSYNDSIWFFKRDFKTIYLETIESLQNQTYQFAPVKKITFIEKDKAPLWIWEARDAWVLKALSLYLQDKLAPYVSKDCVNFKNNGSIGEALKITCKTIKTKNTFVFKSDVKSYYQSMDHSVILRIFSKYTKCSKILEIIKQFLRHVEYDNGFYLDIKQGISKGCPLSPIIGVLYLSELDEVMKNLPVVYQRFADDWIIITNKRWRLRKAIKRCYEILKDLKIERHPDKTYVGRMKDGIDFLGFRISANGIIGLSQSTQGKIKTKLNKLYEQPLPRQKIVLYMTRLRAWVKGIIKRVGCLTAPFHSLLFIKHYMKGACDAQKLKGTKCLLGSHGGVNIGIRVLVRAIGLQRSISKP